MYTYIHIYIYTYILTIRPSHYIHVPSISKPFGVRYKVALRK